MGFPITWRVLIVDDKQADQVEEFISGNRVIESPDTIYTEKCSHFAEAFSKLDTLRLDLVILDLKDDSIELEDENTSFPGEDVFQQIRDRRFIPVIFHTAYAHKVKHLENPFVQVVDRSDPRALREVIKKVFDTRLPHLLRHLESEQREYMWGHVQTHWKETSDDYERTDLAYLLARRLSSVLERSSIRKFLTQFGDNHGPTDAASSIHPAEMYIYPPVNANFLAGDIVKGAFAQTHSTSESPGKIESYWLILTPSCDFAQNKADNILMAKCSLLREQTEYEKFRDGGSKSDLEALIGDNRRKQPERYKFLPGTFFLPDLVVDFQSLIQLPSTHLSSSHRIASMDSPFVESCLARFARYYGRLGTPDLDKTFVIDKLSKIINSSAQQKTE